MDRAGLFVTDSSAAASMVATRGVVVAGAVLGGMAVGWATAGSMAALVGMGLLLAVMNGYSKAYSP